ncbi:MAG: TetR/AcrR family transcriptional regulator [Butyricicoccus sp.]|nr:TetR/AcrR family transcriptional regulator [Butyricicoccus sp.]
MSEARENRRSAILHAACKEFSEKGFAGAKIEEIARKVGIGKSTVYEYFPSKTDLLEQAADWMIGRVAGDVRKIMESSDSFAQKTRAYVLYMCGVMQHMGHGMLYMHGDNKELLCVIRRCTRQFFQNIMDAAMEAVRSGQQRGELREGIDARAVATLMITLPSPLMAEQLDAEGEQALDHMIELMLHGMAPQ